MGYSTDAVKGFSWQTALKFAMAGLTVLKISILARLLSPDQFGVFSLAMIALGLSEATTQTGVNITLLQSKKPIAYFLNSAWVIAIFRGILIGLIMIGMGYGFELYFKQPSLFELVTITALVPVIKGFINPAIIGMRKELKFFHESMYHFTLSVVEAILAIFLALQFHSVDALIYSMIGAATLEVIISFTFFKLKPRFEYMVQRGSIILRSATWLSLSSIMSYLNDNVDDFIVGSTTGTHSLGLYHNGYALSHRANYDLAQSANHGTFPIFAKIADDTNRLRRAFLKTLFSTIIVVSIFSLPLILFSQVSR